MEMLFFLIVLIIIWGITFYKKRSQLGTTWEGPIEATVVIKEKELKCAHCQHNRFSKVEGLLTTTWVTLFRFPFWNKSCACFVCKNCGFVHWFREPKEKANIQRTD